MHGFCNHINSIIFPELGITPKKPISLRTAQHWLIKHGWTHTLIKKGVYEDGHNRADVVLYWQEDFLSCMLEYERRMVHYKGRELKRVEPTLMGGEKEIEPLFHDDSCFHANDASNSAW